MNKILLLGVGMLLCWVPAKGLMCHLCLDFQQYAGCVEESFCEAGPGQKCMIEQIPFVSEVRQGCTVDTSICSTGRLDPNWGGITTLCCDHCDYCNID